MIGGVSLLAVVHAATTGAPLSAIAASATIVAGCLLSLLQHHRNLVKWHTYQRWLILGIAFALSAILKSFADNIILAIVSALAAAFLITIGRTRWDMWPDLRNDTHYHATIRSLYKKENNK